MTEAITAFIFLAASLAFIALGEFIAHKFEREDDFEL